MILIESGEEHCSHAVITSLRLILDKFRNNLTIPATSNPTVRDTEPQDEGWSDRCGTHTRREHQGRMSQQRPVRQCDTAEDVVFDFWGRILGRIGL